MTQHQATLLKRAVSLTTRVNLTLIIDDHCSLDDKMRQAALQCNASAQTMTFQQLLTLLSEGFQVIMWDKWLGEEATLVIINKCVGELLYVRRAAGRYFDPYRAQHSDIYYKCFDLLDRHEQEVGEGIIVDTLVAPYLALVIPQSNS
jgi:hypothetical protein